MVIPVILDTDPGIDDALAIALAVRSPELRLVGVTTTYGNGHVAVTTRNARHLLARLGAGQVPVWAGATRPLVRDLSPAMETHGEEGLGGAEVPALAGAAPLVEAPLMLPQIAARAGEPVTVVALGPLTNIALALALDREACTDGIREIIWMGGSAGAPGNTTPVSEFNSWCDPEAACSVMASGIPIRMVGLDATRSMLLECCRVTEFERHADPEIRWWAAMWRFYVDFHRKSERLEGCILNDPLAVALLLRPDLGQWAPMYVEVDCGPGLTRGQTLCDRFGFTGKPANASVCLAAEGDAAVDFVLERALGLKRG